MHVMFQSMVEVTADRNEEPDRGHGLAWREIRAAMRCPTENLTQIMSYLRIMHADSGIPITYE